MNRFHAKAEWIDGAWRAMVRYSHKATYWPVMAGERPAGYPTRDAALIAALREQERHMNGTVTGFGPKAEAKSAAERLFRPGRKPIPVEVRR